MTDNKINIEQTLINEWRKLGFYYDSDNRLEINQWRFFGSKQGLQNFVTLLDNYINNPNNNFKSEHDHYGPYSYLKIMTWDKPKITEHYIAGTIEDLKHLKNIIAEKLNRSQPGQTFNIDKEYGIENTMTAKFFIMSDDFDPVSMDELIVSARQKIVNEFIENRSQQTGDKQHERTT